MRRAAAVALVLVLASGCASVSGWPFRPSAAMLAKADRLATAGEYDAAVAAYDEFLTKYADDAEAPRARASREAASAVVTSRAELARLRQELAKLREDLVRREADLQRLRTDLEQLKQIDLRLERRGKK